MAAYTVKVLLVFRKSCGYNSTMSDQKSNIGMFFGWVCIVIAIMVLILWMGYAFPDMTRRMHSVGGYVEEFDDNYGEQKPFYLDLE